MDKQLTTFYIVRHGESITNVHFEKPPSFHKQWGELESPLTTLGKEQAKKRELEFKNIQFDAVFSSDLTRARQTAEIIALKRKLAIQTTKVIRERIAWSIIDELQYQGQTMESIEQKMRNELQLLDEKGKHAYKYTDKMESAEEAASRLIKFFREVAIVYKGKTILIVTHGANMRAFLTYLGWTKFDELPGHSVKNTAYIILESDGMDFFIKETLGVIRQKNAKRTL